jgi:hypothetical protein
MKIGIFDFSADVVDGVVRLRVKDHAGRIVANGKGRNTSEAQQNAVEKTTSNGDARKHLQQVVLPDAPFD